jgi:hypothetical protein
MRLSHDNSELIIAIPGRRPAGRPGHSRMTANQEPKPYSPLTRLAYEPRCYWPPPHKSLPSREALALCVGLRPFRQVADTWPLDPADNQPNPCQPIWRLARRDDGLPGHERHQQSPANQRHKVRGLLTPLTVNLSIETHFSPASAGLFERDFISKGARNPRRQKFSNAVRAPSGTSFIHEAAIDGLAPLRRGFYFPPPISHQHSRALPAGLASK